MDHSLQGLNISKYYFSSKPVLESLPKVDLLSFTERLKLRKFKKGKILFQEGTKPKGIYILKRGRVKLFQQTQNGAEQVIYIYSQGEMFGYRPLLCDESHPASAVTLEECGVNYLPAKDFLAILKQSAALSNILLKNLSHEFTVLINRIAAFSNKSAKERIALSLLILQEKYRKPGRGLSAEISLSRADMAAFVGTTNETLARIISGLKREKIIKTVGRKIIILNAEALYRMAD